MAGDIIINNTGGTVNIGGELGDRAELFWTPPEVNIPVAPEGSVEFEIQRSENPGALADMGYDVHPDATGEIPEGQADEERAKAGEAIFQKMEAQEKTSKIRRSYLETLVSEVDIIRGAEGKLRNHRREPKSRARVENQLATYTDYAETTLGRACGSCALSGNCKLEGDLDRWIAVHPYKDVATNKRRGMTRPGSLPEVKTEARVTLLKALSDRERYEPEVHCDPNRRTPKPAPLEQSE